LIWPQNSLWPCWFKLISFSFMVDTCSFTLLQKIHAWSREFFPRNQCIWQSSKWNLLYLTQTCPNSRKKF
jgi:hypothetical protein